LAPADDVQEFARVFLCRWPLERRRGESLLLHAAALGDVAIMRGLLDAKVRVGAREPRSQPAFLAHKGMQPSHTAAMFGHASAVTLLLKRDADADARTPMLDTPLLFAVLAGSSSALKTLLQHRADVTARNMFGNIALDVAAVHGKVEAARVLLRHGAPTAPSEQGMSALHLAALMNSGPAVVQVLLRGRVSPQERCRLRAFSVSWLVTCRFRVARCLGERSALTSLFCALPGATPDVLAEVWGNTAVVRQLMQARGMQTSLANPSACP